MRLHSFLPVCLILVLILSACTFSKAPSDSAEQDKDAVGPFRSYINIPCASVTSGLQNKGSRTDFLLVMNGFMSGTNYLKGRNETVNVNSMATIVDNYCRQYPDQTLTHALIALDRAVDHNLPPAALKPLEETSEKSDTGFSSPVGEGMTEESVAAPSRPVVPARVTVTPTPPTNVKVAPSVPTRLTPAQSAPAQVAAPARTVVPARVATPAAKVPAQQEVTHGFIVLVLSSTDEEESKNVALKLRKSKFPSSVERVDLGERGIWYRVITGPYPDAVAAKKAADQLIAAKYTSAIVRKR